MKGHFTHRQAVALVCVVALLAQTKAMPAQDFCPWVPQSKRPTATISSSRGLVDFTGQAPLPSSLYRVRHGSPSDLVVIGNTTLSNTDAVKALEKSRAQLVLRTSADMSIVTEAARQQTAGIEIWATLPQDAAGVAGMYRPETAQKPAVLSHFKQVGASFEKVPHTVIVSAKQSQTIRERLVQRVKQNRPNDVLIVVGHNENGVLRFPDGSTAKVEELSRPPGSKNGLTIVLSCDTARESMAQGVVSLRPFGFDELAAALQKMPWDRIDKGVSVAGFVTELNVSLTSTRRDTKQTVKVVVAAVAAGVLVAVILSLLSDDDDDTKVKAGIAQ